MVQVWDKILIRHFIFGIQRANISNLIINYFALDIWYSNHLKAGPCPGFGFDFWRLSDLSGFQMVGRPFETRIQKSGFRMAGLDRFVYIYIVYIQNGPTIRNPNFWIRVSNGQQSFYHLKAGPKKCPRDDHLKAGQSGFQMVTVFKWLKTCLVVKWSGFRHHLQSELESLDFKWLDHFLPLWCSYDKIILDHFL
jgi:hypothetical protein